MDGLAASTIILEMEPKTLIVACSAFLDPRGMHDAFEAGVHRCLRKPIRMEEAHRLFENLFEELEVRASN
jgi:CheY-like chemotaxis protein